MKTLASEEVQSSMVAIEDERIRTERHIGRTNARKMAIGRLSILLSEQQEALGIRPYGFGHGWNVWALIVAIEQLRHNKGRLAASTI